MDVLFQTVSSVTAFLSQNLLFLNLLFAIIIVFFERRDPKSVWAWLLLLFFIPGIGFVFYLFLGQNMRKRKRFRVKEIEDHLSEAIRQQEHQIQTRELQQYDSQIGRFTDLIMYNLETSGAVLTNDNDVDFFTDGREKFAALAEDIRKAEHFIHIQYYIIRNDELFQNLVELLKQKAAEGVEVRILFDAMGCRRMKHSYWEKLNAEGIMTAEFFSALFRRLQLRINYRNHRKIVVIDNKVAYVGGFNIGREYVDLDQRFGHWRDTHLRIRGSGVTGLALRFILDWNYASRENLINSQMLFEGIEPGKRDYCELQIITSGPDNTAEQIRDNYLRLISKAEKSIYIQTPYFIPDEAIFDALKIAARSGIEVNIMIPCKPDHPFVYWATLSYVGELVMSGAKCYVYNNGFLHSKGMIVDCSVLCYGTANMDIRSFALNFEVNAVLYSQEKAYEMEKIFREDLKVCTRITKERYAGRKLDVRFKEQVCRLLSPLL